MAVSNPFHPYMHVQEDRTTNNIALSGASCKTGPLQVMVNYNPLQPRRKENKKCTKLEPVRICVLVNSHETPPTN